MSATKIPARIAIIFVSVLSLYGCTCHQKTEDKTIEFLSFELDEVAIPGELLIQLDETVNLTTLQSAWAIFDPQLEWVGPEAHRLLKMTVTPNYDIALVKENVSATKGVLAVQLNYRRSSIETLELVEPSATSND